VTGVQTWALPISPKPQNPYIIENSFNRIYKLLIQRIK